MKNSLMVLAFAVCVLIPSRTPAATAKYAAVDNLLTTCSITSTGTLSTATPLVTLAGLTDCTGTNVTTNASGNTVTANTDGPNWVVVSTASLHVSNSQSIFVTPSLVTGLYTEVKNNSGNNTSTSTAQVILRVVDLSSCALSGNNYGSASAPCGTEIAAEPVVDCTTSVLGCVSNGNGTYGVNFDQRILGLSSNLNLGEFIDLAIATADGHSFGFGFDDVTVGTHLIAVEAAVNVSGSGNSLSAAAFGLGFTTVEAVQLTQGANDMNF